MSTSGGAVAGDRGGLDFSGASALSPLCSPQECKGTLEACGSRSVQQQELEQ